MTRVLFVTNGHGETAIAERIAVEIRAIAPAVQLDHLALVGDVSAGDMHEVGPRRRMPSGGLIAMGNVWNITRDLRAGLLGLTLAQRKFLRGAQESYDAAVVVGDAYALAMASAVRKPLVFVGTAKSVAVAPYGPFERRILRNARECFVRDEATARELRRYGLKAEVANAIVDLFATPDDPAAQAVLDGFDPALALFPGSRESAYDDGAFLLDVTRRLAESRPSLGAALSIARGLEPQRFARDAAARGWHVRATSSETTPFVLSDGGRELVRAWCGGIGPLLRRVTLVMGQAGTANEAAAAAGVPIVAFERERNGKARWYRRRQQGLLGDALAVFRGQSDDAVAGVASILNDPARRREMGATGRARMGEPGGARRIAERVVSLVRRS